MINKIINILENIGLLLSLCSFLEEADWIKKRAIELRAASNESEEKAILTQVKTKIAGMGSLSDIYLLPPETAGISKQEANQKLGELIRDLDKHINDVLDT
jgi:hypothetical protein